MIVAENVGYISSHWGEIDKISSMSGVEKSPSKRAHLAGGPWQSKSLDRLKTRADSTAPAWLGVVVLVLLGGNHVPSTNINTEYADKTGLK
jgi:hypothetical protein